MTVDIDDMHRALAVQIRVELAGLGMSQKELAARVGITEGALSRYMKGHREMPMTVYLEVSNVLGVEPDYLMRSAQARLRK
ncbi:helix-turn-helix transcriptional regulator [Auritidibacter ignavus]|uniref:Helix-turn-helix transcriptional regulator n=1 Tax=Auritidibacter ignavus TaxID=678932 RepID=A0AAJ6DE22_9MICC|nr:helix-turn-helix transcriptional regulator [Auritidibacter ignavus]WGH92128.1 helix-turn-helix transcriptional regulator [Auritidibacter ignavus]